jgi:WD40 repeat protein
MFSESFSPDGRFFAVKYSTGSLSTYAIKLRVWSVLTWQQLYTVDEGVDDWFNARNFAFTTDGARITSKTPDYIRIIDTGTGQIVREILPPAFSQTLAPFGALLSPDGKWLLVDYEIPHFPLRYGAVHVYDTETGEEKSVLPIRVYDDWRFSRDSKMLVVSASADVGKVTQRAVAEIWDVESWTKRRVIEAPSGWQGVFTVDFSPDGQVLAIGGRRKFGLFSVETGELLAEREHPTGTFESELTYNLTWVEFSKNGKMLLTGGNDGKVNLWKVKYAAAQ